MKQCNTRSPVASSIKLPLRGRGLYLHDARDQYASLSISPPYTRMCIGRKFILRRRGQRSFFAAEFFLPPEAAQLTSSCS